MPSSRPASPTGSMPIDRESAVAVLISGGLDSAVLAVDLLRGSCPGLPALHPRRPAWEEIELAAPGRFLPRWAPGLELLTVLDEPIADVYGPHWSTGGDDVPGAETPDEAVYLPGRNLLLTVKAAVWCRLREVDALALGSLGSNPFPDSTPGFFDDLESVLSQAMDGAPRLIRPFDRCTRKTSSCGEETCRCT